MLSMVESHCNGGPIFHAPPWREDKEQRAPGPLLRGHSQGKGIALVFGPGTTAGAAPAPQGKGCASDIPLCRLGKGCAVDIPLRAQKKGMDSSDEFSECPLSPLWFKTPWNSPKRRTYLWREAADQLEMGLPIAGTYVLDFLMQTVSLSFVGHLGTLPPAAAAMASSLINIIGFSCLEGLASAMETICGQAYGAEDFFAIGDVAQRVHLILTTFCIPLAFVLLNTEPLLLLIGQDPDVATAAAQYVQWELPGLFVYAAFLPIGKFMEVQGATMPLTVISLLSLALHVALNPLCIYTMGLGFLGAPIAYSVTNVVQLLLALAYLAFLDREELVTQCWRGWSLSVALQGWAPYLELAVPSCLMICLEWWFLEVLIFLAGLLPEPQVNLAAMSVALQSEEVLFMLPLAMSIAASVRVSNELGAGEAPAAKYAALVAVLLAVVIGLALSLLLWAMCSWLPLIFMPPSETRVIERTEAIMPWLIGCETVFGVSTVLSSIVRGSGQQHRGSLINLIAFYFFGLPVAYLLAFWPMQLGVVVRGSLINLIALYFFSLPVAYLQASWPLQLGVLGLWGGIVVSLTFQTSTLAMLTALTNWSHQVDRAEATIEANKVDSDKGEEFSLLGSQRSLSFEGDT